MNMEDVKTMKMEKVTDIKSRMAGIAFDTTNALIQVIQKHNVPADAHSMLQFMIILDDAKKGIQGHYDSCFTNNVKRHIEAESNGLFAHASFDIKLQQKENQ